MFHLRINVQYEEANKTIVKMFWIYNHRKPNKMDNLSNIQHYSFRTTTLLHVHLFTVIIANKLQMCLLNEEELKLESMLTFTWLKLSQLLRGRLSLTFTMLR